MVASHKLHEPFFRLRQALQSFLDTNVQDAFGDDARGGANEPHVVIHDEVSWSFQKFVDGNEERDSVVLVAAVLLEPL